MRTHGLGVLAVVAVCAGGCGGDAGGGPSDPYAPPPGQPPGTPGGATSSASVSMSGSQFVPASVSVKAGGTVTWTNNDAVAHTATGTGFDTGSLGTNASSSKTFANVGTFNYSCSFHAGMTGQVIVVQ